MKSMKILRFLSAFLITMFIGGALSAASGLPLLATSGGLLGLSMFPKPAGVLRMALDVEMWKSWIVEELFKDNQFLNFATNADEYVLQGKVVHIPNAGTASEVKRNRTSLPAMITKRTDVDITYALDEYTSNPRLITDADTLLSYDKKSSAMGQDMSYIKQLVAEWMLYNWRVESSSFMVRTTGDAVAAHVASATGNRKAFKPENLEEAQALMDENDVPNNDRFAMFDARMYQQFIRALGPNDSRDFSALADMKNGVIGQYAGFKVLKRSTVLRSTNASTPVVKTPATSGAAADNGVALCWQKDCVERAIGEVKVFESNQDPQYYGDIYSLLVRAGGRKIRNDEKGVVGIIQASTT